MRELRDIVDAYDSSENNGQLFALATLVQVAGSTYRQPGARMLLRADDSWVGALSGGCLEADISERAQSVIQTGQPRLAIYDTTSDDDIIWGLGLGCQGIAHVLIEPLSLLDPLNPVSMLRACLQHLKPGGVATLFRASHTTERLGTVLLNFPDGTSVNRIASVELRQAVYDDLLTAIEYNRSTIKEYTIAEEQFEIALQVVQPPVMLVIFGAGYDVVPVVQLAKQLGWHVTVVDCRARSSTLERFQIADSILLSTPERVWEKLQLCDRTAAVIMTHNYYYDLELLETLLPQHLSYLGLLGPKSRAQRLINALEAKAKSLVIEQKQLLNSPIGLDIGAENPDEIALSIVSEIQAVITQRQGGSLRHRETPIHKSLCSIYP